MALSRVGARLRASVSGSAPSQPTLSTTKRTLPSGARPTGRHGADERTRSLAEGVRDAASSGEVDAGKFDLLIKAQQRSEARQQRVAFDVAFAAMQSELPTIPENGCIRDGLSNSPVTYALWEDINEIIKPILSRFGFGLRFRTAQSRHAIVVTAVLSHTSGHTEDTTMRLPADLTGNKNGVQAIGSSTSYGKRYTASALLNLTSRGEDDNGSAATQSGKLTAAEIAELRRAIAVSAADEQKLCGYLGVASLEALGRSQLTRARAAINAKRGRS